MDMHAETIVYVSLINGVSPPLAHLERRCSLRRLTPPRRVATIWQEATNASCRLCSLCAHRFEVVHIDSGRPVRRLDTIEVAAG